MAAIKITTDRQIAGSKPREAAYEAPIYGVRGLSIRVFPTGAKHWVFRYVTLGGTRPRMPLGEYPALTLAEATKRANALRVQVAEGGDPAAKRQAERARARTGDTLKELCEAYFAAAEKGLHGGRKRPKRTSSIEVEKSRFRLHIEPKLGPRRFTEISRSDVKQFMRGLATGGMSGDSVASIGRTFSAVMAFAVHEERLDANPVVGLTQPLGLKQRDRMFSEEALRSLWGILIQSTLAYETEDKESAVRGSGVQPAVALAVRLAALTLTRRADVADARWEEVDHRAKTWTIPAARHKSGRPHVVPLEEEALKVLAEAAKLHGDPKAKRDQMRTGFIFPSPVKEGRPITPHAMTRAVTRICADLKLPHGSPHDLRRNGPTLLTSERGGIRRFIVTKVLGQTAHEGAVVTAVYDRNEYLSDKRRALRTWEELLMEIVGGQGERDNAAED